MRSRFSNAQWSKINISLRRKIQKLHTSGTKSKIPVIVKFRNKVIESHMHALQQYMRPYPLTIEHQIPLLNAATTHITVSALKKLSSWQGIEQIYLDDVNKATLNVAIPSVGSIAVQRGAQGLTGKGINIAVLDTGIYPHADLTWPTNRIVAFKDFIHERTLTYDDNGHGTHIAGALAGNGYASNGKYIGAAPEAGIVGIKVLDSYGATFDSIVIKGIEWCISNRNRLNIRILNMSFGRKQVASIKDDLICQAIKKAVESGLIVVASAGNNGPLSRTIQCPGTCPQAITVGAVKDQRTTNQKDDRVCLFSSRGPVNGGVMKPDLVAPGESIVSLQALDGKLVQSAPGNKVGKSYFKMSGTSVSTPIVAGVVAQMLQERPFLTPAQVKSILKRNCYRVKGRKTRLCGSGILNARFMLNKL